MKRSFKLVVAALLIAAPSLFAQAAQIVEREGLPGDQEAQAFLNGIISSHEIKGLLGDQRFRLDPLYYLVHGLKKDGSKEKILEWVKVIAEGFHDLRQGSYAVTRTVKILS